MGWGGVVGVGVGVGGSKTFKRVVPEYIFFKTGCQSGLTPEASMIVWPLNPFNAHLSRKRCRQG